MAVSKISKGNGFAGALSYVLDKEGATLIESQGVSASDPLQLARDMRAVADSASVKRPVLHVSFSAPPGEHPTDAQWQTLARTWLKEMGADLDRTQFVLARHTDREHDHVHLVANRVGLDGKVLSDQKDFKRSHEAMRIAEKAAGMQAFENSDERAPKGRAAELRTRINGVFNESGKTSFGEFERRLKAQGITVVLNKSVSTGRISGLSFHGEDGLRFKGSSLGKGYSLSGLQAKGLQLSQSQKQVTPRRTNKYSLIQFIGRVSGRPLPSFIGLHSTENNRKAGERWLRQRAAAEARARRKKKQLEQEVEDEDEI